VEQRRFHEYIVQECGRLSAMIENVLNLARIEQGRQEYEFAPADAWRLVTDTVQLMAPTAAEGQVALQLAADGSQFTNAAETPVFDGRAMHQVLINLIDNAIKHSPPLAIVTVGLEWMTEPEAANDGPFGDTPFIEADQPPHRQPAAKGGIGAACGFGGRSGTGHSAGRTWENIRAFLPAGLRVAPRDARCGHRLKHRQACGRSSSRPNPVESEVDKGSRFVVELPMNPEENQPIR